MAKAKRPGKVPWGALVWTTAAGALAWRTFYHPARGVVADGFVSQCAGRVDGACIKGMTIDSFAGTGPVYSMAAGRVLEVSPRLKIAAAHEPVILVYAGASVQPQVGIGEEISLGQQIALAPQVVFGVTQVQPSGGGQLKEIALEPASWLAARGLRVSVKRHKADATGPNWCEGGRKLVVPETTGLCNLQLPPPAGLMLLPVSVTMGRG